MAEHYRELLAAARLLLTRPYEGRGRLPSARVRRSISTAYYAIFHFVQQECAATIVGANSRRRRRRRMFVRTLSHTGIKLSFEKVAGRLAAADVAAFLLSDDAPPEVPLFASSFAKIFIEAQRQRHDADYDLNALFGELDAYLLILAVDLAIDGWIAATTPGDRDFKHALCLLMVLGGKLRSG